MGNLLRTGDPAAFPAVRELKPALPAIAPRSFAARCREAPALGAAAGLRETARLREVTGGRHRWHAVRGYLHELDGDLPAAASRYAEAARRATNVAARDHLIRQAARARAAWRHAAAVTGGGWQRLNGMSALRRKAHCGLPGVPRRTGRPCPRVTYG